MAVAREDWAFIFGPRDEVIDRDHPDFDYWAEAHAVEDWVADGAPALEPEPAPHPPSTAQPEKSPRPPVPTLALNLSDAASALDVSDEFFREHVKPELRIVRRGRRQFIARSELERWLTESSEPHE